MDCDEDVALDIDAKRVNVINLRDAQKKASGNCFLENRSSVLAAIPDLATRILYLLPSVKLMGPATVDCVFSQSYAIGRINNMRPNAKCDRVLPILSRVCE